VSKALSRDVGKVDLTVEIDHTYAPLVRENTEFWDAGGVKASLGFFWIKVDSTPLASLTLGGIAFATPNDSAMGPRAASGRRFTLHPEPRREWLRWKPSLPGDMRK
jgi:paraquat-inducible protein B